MRTSNGRRTMVLLFSSIVVLVGCRGTGLFSSNTTAVDNDPQSESPESDQEFTTTVSGLKYRILRESDGERPQPSDSVEVHYRGWLADGTEFDNSYQRGKPETFKLDQVVPGWTEGVALIGEGGKIELEVPPDLGYGQRGSPPVIPPDATLHFEIELIKVGGDD